MANTGCVQVRLLLLEPIYQSSVYIYIFAYKNLEFQSHLPTIFVTMVTMGNSKFAPENGWLEYDRYASGFLLRPGLFSRAF